MKAIETIETKINQLSPGLISELDHYLDYLLSKRIVRMPKKLKQDWAGGLKDIKMTGIELQKFSLGRRLK